MKKLLMQKKNIPNILSLVRLLMIPAFVWIYFTEEAPKLWSTAVFLSAEITDVIDGYLARKYNWITETGKILDPMADKLMQAAVMVSLSIENRFFIWIAAIFFAKELTMVTGALVLAKKISKVTPSSWFGKMATVVFAAVTVVFIIYPDNTALNVILTVTLAGVLIFALLMYYFTIFRKVGKASKE